MRRAARDRQAATDCGGWRAGHNGGDAATRHQFSRAGGSPKSLSDRRGGRSPVNGRALEDQYARLDDLDARLRATRTLDGRRKAARELFAVLADTDRAMRDDARRSGEDARLTGLRCDEACAGVLGDVA